jgi:hypothetical protein
MPAEQRKKYEKLVDDSKKKWELIREEANQISFSTIKLEAGSEELKFFPQKEINTVTALISFFEFVQSVR